MVARHREKRKTELLSRKQQLYWALGLYVALVAIVLIARKSVPLAMSFAALPWLVSAAVALLVGACYRFRPEKIRTIYITWTVVAVVVEVMAVVILSLPI
ncbi:MAG: hypothetical protein O7I42_03845 [Alphaproteobacteria bacterium]|nr:hypothetical protein [Alphaproteobacteria bacterium]